jgi:hypothetical protein
MPEFAELFRDRFRGGSSRSLEAAAAVRGCFGIPRLLILKNGIKKLFQKKLGLMGPRGPPQYTKKWNPPSPQD